VSLTSFILLEAREDQPVTVKVSVVVPVYNPGRHISYCIDSVLGQSLPPDEIEAIFVDDGSTDGTDKVLDDLAAAHRHIRVIHIPNSGWPGRPRNIGTDAGTGRYVHYLDNDDALGTEALERLYAFAEANASDIVIGRYAGHHRAVAREIFRETVFGFTPSRFRISYPCFGRASGTRSAPSSSSSRDDMTGRDELG